MGTPNICWHHLLHVRLSRQIFSGWFLIQTETAKDGKQDENKPFVCGGNRPHLYNKVPEQRQERERERERVLCLLHRVY